MTLGEKHSQEELSGDHGYFSGTKEMNRVQHGFIWAPGAQASLKPHHAYHWNQSVYKKEVRTPVFWLARKGPELYFVNNSYEMLDLVSTHTGGCETCDNEVVTISDDVGFTYRNVKPNEAVKIDQYDDVHDIDYLQQVALRIESKKQGCINMLTQPAKGGIKEEILLWNTGESGNVTITHTPMF